MSGSRPEVVGPRPKAADLRPEAARGVIVVLVVFASLLEAVNPLWDDGLVRLMLTTIHAFIFPALAFLIGLTTPSHRFLGRVVTIGMLVVGIHCLGFLAQLAAGTAETWSWTTPHGILWFFVALIGWLLTVPLVQRFPRVLSGLACVMGIGAGLLPIPSEPFPLLQALIFWPFFVLGNAAGPRLLRVVTGLPVWTRVGLCIVAVVPLLTLFVARIGDGWLLGSSTFDDLGVSDVRGLLIRFCLSLIALLAITALLAAVPNTQNALARRGERWVSILLLHGFALIVLAPALTELFAGGYDHAVQFGAVTLCAFVAVGIVALLSVSPVHLTFTAPVQWIDQSRSA